MIDIFRYYWSLALQLLIWGGLSLLLGASLLAAGSTPFFRGFALQMAIWGAVNVVLAVLAGRKALRGSREHPDEYHQVRQTVRLRRILRINARLDVLYCLVGAGLLLLPANLFARGNGLGVLLQGVFLLLFDALHARHLPADTPAWYDPAV